MYHRWQLEKIQEALTTRRVILLSGARQCGKSTLSAAFASTPNIYRTLDNMVTLEAAHIDPHDFVKHENELMIIDEIQRCPQLLPAIKMDVDMNQHMGRFLLTGSANIQSLPAVQESLAGRVRHLRLRPLAMGEIEGTNPLFLTKIFSKDFSVKNVRCEPASPSRKDYYIDSALKGGYPEPLLLQKIKSRQEWHKDYLVSLIQKDLKEIINLKRTNSLYNLLEILAAWSSRFIDFSAIGSGLSITQPTLHVYINALEMLYLIERVPAWTKTVYDRVGKKDKLFMTDTGTMGHLLKWTPEKVMLDGSKSGILMETFVFAQIMTLIDASMDTFTLFHYRDKDKREIDFIIENEDGAIAAIEVKAGTSISKKSFQHMHWFKNNLAQERPFIGIILYAGTEPLSFGDGFWALPIDSLWKM
jgi:predicted AAA+ superfamily ATPase